MSVVDDVRRQIGERLKELKPLVDEYHQLEAMIERLKDGDRGSTTAARTTRPRRTRAARTTTGGRRRGRPRGSGTRAAQALELVNAKPGITIPEMGKEMGITPNYLYRVLPELAKDGKVKKQGKGWVPA
jgi:hypothetical protein